MFETVPKIFRFDWTQTDTRACLLNSFETVQNTGGTRKDAAIHFLARKELPITDKMVGRCVTAFYRIVDVPPEQKLNALRSYKKWTSGEIDYIVSALDNAEVSKKLTAIKLSSEFKTSYINILRRYYYRKNSTSECVLHSVEKPKAKEFLTTKYLNKLYKLNPTFTITVDKSLARIIKVTYMPKIEVSKDKGGKEVITQSRYNQALVAIEKLKEENARMAKKLNINTKIVTTSPQGSSSSFVVPVNRGKR